MRGSSFGYLVKEGFRNIFQNRALSLAAIGVLMACLLLIGSSMLFTENINAIVGYFESQNEILVFLSDRVVGEEINDIEQEIKNTPNVASVSFISREQGLEEWMKRLGDDGTLLGWLTDDNPLQNSFCVVVRDLSVMNETVEIIGFLDGVENISASAEVASAVSGLKQAVHYVGYAIIAILALVSFSIVTNTIRITIFNRRKEISIMKYVGATDAFIRLPFISEGILLGTISAVFAFLLLWLGYFGLTSWLVTAEFSWAAMLSTQMVPFTSVALKIFLSFLAGGVTIGILGSSIFVGKYINV